jgi:hypothetical protein
MTTVVIKRDRKGEIVEYRHVGRWARWFNPAPECWGGRRWIWHWPQLLRPFFAFEFELGERVAVALISPERRGA